MRLEYDKVMNIKRCIAIMVTRQNSDLKKNMMSCGVNINGSKTRKIRTKCQLLEEGVQKQKMKQSYQVIGQGGIIWYTKDGHDYSKT